MPITNDDQIDYERVVTDAEYRRHVIVYLNTQARRMDRARSGQRSAAMSGALGRSERPANQLLRRLG
jgi:hypothetical protein